MRPRPANRSSPACARWRPASSENPAPGASQPAPARLIGGMSSPHPPLRSYGRTRSRTIKPRPGGRLRFASDWADYVNWSLDRLIAAPGLAWTAERADDWRAPPADHVTTRYEEKRLGDCAPVFLEFVKS